MNPTAPKTAPRKIVDKPFSTRIEEACRRHPRAPTGHGQQIWLLRELEEKVNMKVSREAVRKWFSGEARPRPQVMSKVALVLEVDEAWLSLGITPSQSPIERKRHNAVAHGAVNLAAGLFQLAGGNVAFPDGADKGFDFMAIMDGKSYAVEVKYVAKAEKAKIAVSPELKGGDLIILVSGEAARLGSYDLYNISREFLEKHGVSRGGYVELDLELDGSYKAGDDYLPIIKDFARLDGEVPKRKPKAFV